MGITIIQKSDLGVRKKDAKVALVLAGGALTGGAFKLGGLKALDDFLINRKVVDFDVYVGLSAGAMLGAPLAAGVPPSEMLRALDGTSVQFSRFRPGDFNIPGTVVGVLFLGTIATGLTLLNLQTYLINLVQGAILVVAVLLSTVAARRA